MSSRETGGKTSPTHVAIKSTSPMYAKGSHVEQCHLGVDALRLALEEHRSARGEVESAACPSKRAEVLLGLIRDPLGPPERAGPTDPARSPRPALIHTQRDLAPPLDAQLAAITAREGLTPYVSCSHRTKDAHQLPPTPEHPVGDAPFRALDI